MKMRKLENVQVNMSIVFFTISLAWHNTATGSTSKLNLLAMKHLEAAASSRNLGRSAVLRWQIRLWNDVSGITNLKKQFGKISTWSPSHCTLLYLYVLKYEVLRYVCWTTMTVEYKQTECNSSMFCSCMTDPARLYHSEKWIKVTPKWWN